MKNMENGNAIITIVVIIFIILVIAAMGSGSSFDDNRDYKREAYIMSQEFIKDELKSPSTAKFPTYTSISVIEASDKHKEYGDHEVYEVDAYVDSENGFGAMIRTDYFMTLKRKADDTWVRVYWDLF